MKALTKYLVFSFAVILVYTVVEFLTSMNTGITHDTLTTCLYAFFGTEVGACCLIRIIDRPSVVPSTEDAGKIEDLEPQNEFDGSMDDIQEEESYG